MVDYPANCRTCGARNIITLPEGEIFTTTHCDNHVCRKCGETGMNYPVF